VFDAKLKAMRCAEKQVEQRRLVQMREERNSNPRQLQQHVKSIAATDEIAFTTTSTSIVTSAARTSTYSANDSKQSLSLPTSHSGSVVVFDTPMSPTSDAFAGVCVPVPIRVRGASKLRCCCEPTADVCEAELKNRESNQFVCSRITIVQFSYDFCILFFFCL
jgi:hypothetical protein